MQIELHGQDYFLNFVEDESRWYVFERTLTGVRRLAVYEDIPKNRRIGILAPGDPILN